MPCPSLKLLSSVNFQLPTVCNYLNSSRLLQHSGHLMSVMLMLHNVVEWQFFMILYLVEVWTNRGNMKLHLNPWWHSRLCHGTSHHTRIRKHFYLSCFTVCHMLPMSRCSVGLCGCAGIGRDPRWQGAPPWPHDGPSRWFLASRCTSLHSDCVLPLEHLIG